MIFSDTTLGNEVSIVLQHIEAVVQDDSFYLRLRPLLRLRNTQVNGLALERFGFPILGRVGYGPVVHFGISHAQSALFHIETGLRPIDPQTKLQAQAVGFVSDWGQTIWKLF